MKLSIWQQFTSNHKNSFAVVGKFETKQDAHFAYLTIRRVIRLIIEAHQEAPPDWIPNPDEEHSYFPTQAEIQILEPYGVVPKRLTDWTTYPININQMCMMLSGYLMIMSLFQTLLQEARVQIHLNN